eukprot:gene5722-5962_t
MQHLEDILQQLLGFTTTGSRTWGGSGCPTAQPLEGQQQLQLPQHIRLSRLQLLSHFRDDTEVGATRLSLLVVAGREEIIYVELQANTVDQVDVMQQLLLLARAGLKSKVVWVLHHPEHSVTLQVWWLWMMLK